MLCIYATDTLFCLYELYDAKLQPVMELQFGSSGFFRKQEYTSAIITRRSICPGVVTPKGAIAMDQMVSLKGQTELFTHAMQTV